MDVSNLPVVGRLVGAAGLLLDVVLSGGEFITLLVSFLVDGLLGQPELLVSILITLDRLGERIPYLPAGWVDTILTAALVALLVVYVGRLTGTFGNGDTA